MKILLVFLAALSLSPQNPYRAAAGHSPYEVPEYKDTPAPAGYKPFYVSHYGRHGSRYHGSDKIFSSTIPAIERLKKAGRMTPAGDSLYCALSLLKKEHEGMIGILTPRGAREHAGIAARLYCRCPSLFRQKDRRVVWCEASSVQRCLQSMAAFTIELKGKEPSLDIREVTGDRYRQKLSPHYPDSKGLGRVNKQGRRKILSALDSDSICRRLFGCSAAEAEECAATERIDEFLLKLFEAVAIGGCLDFEYSGLGDFFSEDDIKVLAAARNLNFCVSYSHVAEYGTAKEEYCGGSILRSILADADAAVAGNDRCANLRFGHDSGLGPLLSILRVEGYDRIVPLAEAGEWPAWKYTPMGSNLQMIFYRNGKGSVLVKILRNENETTIPAVKTYAGPYYRWKDLRAYFMEQLGEWQPLPERYSDYLQSKLERVKVLQKDEAAGFYFWSDPHFPDNAGNVAPVLDYLISNSSSRRVIFGGDAGATVDSLEKCFIPFCKAASRIESVTDMYMVRGNHDFVNRTGRPGGPKRTILSQMATADSIFVHTGKDVVRNVADSSAAYYYCDDLKGGVRYVFLDTTDSVEGDMVRYGMHSSQIVWIVENAVLKAPKGCRLVFFSHTPLSRDNVNNPEIAVAGELVDALSAHRKFSFGGKVYDFSARKDMAVLCAISGHRHHDSHTVQAGVFHIISTADCLDPGYSLVSVPYLPDIPRRKAGTVEEQSFDYVSLSKDFKHIRMERIGAGHNRMFNLRALELRPGKDVAVHTVMEGPVKWYVYDSDGNILVKKGAKHWDMKSTRASVSQEGVLKYLSEGEAFAVAVDASGNSESFIINCIGQ